MQGLCRGWEVLIGALSPPRPALPRLNSEQSELCNAGARAPGRARGGHTEGGISCEDKKAKTRRRHISYFISMLPISMPNLKAVRGGRRTQPRTSSFFYALINLVKKQNKSPPVKAKQTPPEVKPPTC